MFDTVSGIQMRVTSMLKVRYVQGDHGGFTLPFIDVTLKVAF